MLYMLANASFFLMKIRHSWLTLTRSNNKLDIRLYECYVQMHNHNIVFYLFIGHIIVVHGAIVIPVLQCISFSRNKIKVSMNNILEFNRTCATSVAYQRETLTSPVTWISPIRNLDMIILLRLLFSRISKFDFKNGLSIQAKVYFLFWNYMPSYRPDMKKYRMEKKIRIRGGENTINTKNNCPMVLSLPGQGHKTRQTVFNRLPTERISIQPRSTRTSKSV